jgi:hypothetical protein
MIIRYEEIRPEFNTPIIMLRPKSDYDKIRGLRQERTTT